MDNWYDSFFIASHFVFIIIISKQNAASNVKLLEITQDASGKKDIFLMIQKKDRGRFGILIPSIGGRESGCQVCICWRG